MGPDFTVYSFKNRTGFTVPIWLGSRSVQIDPDAAAWLAGLGLPVTTDLRDDADGDGVSLLMAYALNLDPRGNLRGRLPVPVVSGESISISFYGATPGVTYRVETSSDLTSWTPEGVTLSAPDAAGQRTGSVPLDGGSRFLRLKVVR